MIRTQVPCLRQTIALSWSQINNATNYRIDVSTSSSFSSYVSPYNSYATPTGSPYAPTTFTLSGLTPGTLYYIRVRAENGGGQSVNSNRVSATTIPSAPTGTAATPVDHQSFQANWNAQSGASYYLLYVSTNSGFSSYVSGYNGTSVSGTSRVVSGLSPNTTHYYRLRAVNTFGQSGYSNTISTITGPPVPSILPPTAITARWLHGQLGNVIRGNRLPSGHLHQQWVQFFCHRIQQPGHGNRDLGIRKRIGRWGNLLLPGAGL